MICDNLKLSGFDHPLHRTPLLQKQSINQNGLTGVLCVKPRHHHIRQQTGLRQKRLVPDKRNFQSGRTRQTTVFFLASLGGQQTRIT